MDAAENKLANGWSSLALQIAPPTVTAQQKRAVILPGKGVRFFPDKRYVAAKELLGRALLACAPLPAFLEGAVEVRVHMVFAWRKSERAAVKRAGELVPHCTRPDLDNLSKLAIDSLVDAGILADDGQIASLTLAKSWGPPSRQGVYYALRRMEPPAGASHEGSATERNP